MPRPPCFRRSRGPFAPSGAGSGAGPGRSPVSCRGAPRHPGARRRVDRAVRSRPATDWGAVRAAPDLTHLFGTDEVGRDVLARIVYTARGPSHGAGLTSVALAVALGLPLGMLAGYAGGVIDGAIMRLTDALLAIPFLILAIALAPFSAPASPTPWWRSGSRRPRSSCVSPGAGAGRGGGGLRRGGAGRRQPTLAHRAPPHPAQHRAGDPRTRPPSHDRGGDHRRGEPVLPRASAQQPPEPSWGSMLNTAKNFLDQAPWMRSGPDCRSSSQCSPSTSSATGCATPSTRASADEYRPPLLDVRDLAVAFDTDGGTVHAVNGVSYPLREARPWESSASRARAERPRAGNARAGPAPPGRITGGQVFFAGRDLLAMPERHCAGCAGPRSAWCSRTR